MRVFALSDIHVDYPVNAQWIANLSAYDFIDDIIILAGDVSHNLHKLETTLVNLNERFKQVLFIPGNHDIWIMKHERLTSIEKFAKVCALANSIGATTQPFKHKQMTIIPLMSWYDYSFGQPDEALKSMWVDYIACSWPNSMSNPEISDYFLEQNHQHLNLNNDVIITFSHFLPRIDVMPSYIPQSNRFLYPVLGSTKLDHQIRQINANIHVYGHSHVNRTVKIDGVTYINNAFAYPKEHRIAAKTLRCIYEI